MSTVILDNLDSISSNELCILSANVRSLTAKIDQLRLALSSSKVDILCVQETWKLHDFVNYSIDGYGNPLHVSRKHSRGGGVAFFVKKGIELEYCNTHHFKENVLEVIEIGVRANNERYRVINCYKPPQAGEERWLPILEKVVAEKRVTNSTVVVGDFNCNLNEGKHKQGEYVGMLTELGLKQLIDRPTRVTGSSATLIDHIWTSSKEAKSFITDLRISDHDATGILLPGKQHKAQKQKKTSRHLYRVSDENREEIKSLIMQADIPAKLNGKNAEQAFNLVHDAMLEALDKAAKVQIRQRDKKARPVWISKEAEDAKSEAEKLYKLAKAKKASWETYQAARQLVNRLYKRDKNCHFNRELESATDGKKTWGLINQLLRRKSRDDGAIEALEVDGEKITSSESIANSLNDFFANVGTRLEGKLPQT